MSLDTIESHKAFADKYQLNFPLISDTEGQVTESFGVPVSGQYAARMTFIVGKDGAVARVFPKVDPRGHAAEVLQAIGELGL